MAKKVENDNKLSPAFEYIEWLKCISIDDFVKSAMDMIGNYMVGLLNSSEEDTKVLYGEFLAMRTFWREMMENHKFLESKAKGYDSGNEMRSKIHAYLTAFDDHKITVGEPDIDEDEVL